MRWSRGCRFARWRDSILGQDLPESVGTIADWAALSGLVIVGVGLRRARRWARVSGWILGLALVGFGLYWLAAVKEPPPVPNLLTQAGMPWPAFLWPGVVLLAGLSLDAFMRRRERTRA